MRMWKFENGGAGFWELACLDITFLLLLPLLQLLAHFLRSVLSATPNPIHSFKNPLPSPPFTSSPSPSSLNPSSPTPALNLQTHSLIRYKNPAIRTRKNPSHRKKLSRRKSKKSGGGNRGLGYWAYRSPKFRDFVVERWGATT